MTRKVHLELVERFDELHVGARILILACRCCGSSHTRVLVRLRTGFVHDYGSRADSTIETYWETDADVCAPDESAPALSADAVAQRRVYLILDGVEDPEATETTAPKELELAR